MSISTNLMRCVSELLLLFLIEEKDMYAYQLLEVLKARSEGLLLFHESTIYAVLYRLVKHGFVSHRPAMYNKRFRIYYHLEPAGKQYLEESRREYMKLSCGVSLILGRRGKTNGQ